MIHTQRTKTVLLSAVIFAFIQFDAFALSLDEVLKKIENSSAVQSANLALQAARSDLARAGYAGDFTLALSSQAKATTEFVAPFPEQTEVGGTLTARIPVGLSDEERVRYDTARNALETAQIRLDQARRTAYVEAYALYLQAYLAQREQTVLQAELAAARAYADALDKQFQLGKVSLVDLTAADDDLRKKEGSATQGALLARLSWLRLADLVRIPLTPETPELESVASLDVPADLPRPSEMFSKATEGNPDFEELTATLASLRSQISLLDKPPLTASLQLLGGAADHNVSLSYAFQQPELSAAYNFPLYSAGQIPGNNSGNLSNTWNVGIGVSLSFGGGKGNGLDKQGLQTSYRQSEERLDVLRRALELDIRSRYQEWLSARDGVSQSESALKRAETNGATIDSRSKLGLTSQYEVLQAKAAVDRARFAVLAAKSLERTRLLNAALGSGYLETIQNEIQDGGK